MNNSSILSVVKAENTNIEPDWSREKIKRWWSPAPQLIKSIRQYQKWKRRGGFLGNLISKYYVLTHRFWSVVTGAEIPLSCQIGGGLVLPHPNGVVIHETAVIGVNCSIMQQVTITAYVQVGNGVLLSTGAKIVGKKVKIGDYAVIGANAVVIRNGDVPPGATAVGVPARIILPSNKSEPKIDET